MEPPIPHGFRRSSPGRYKSGWAEIGWMPRERGLLLGLWRSLTLPEEGDNDLQLPTTLSPIYSGHESRKDERIVFREELRVVEPESLRSEKR